MRLPPQTAAVTRRTSSARADGRLAPSGCNVFKAALCAASVAACAISCAAGPAACISCFGALGMSSCMDCL